MKSIVKKLIQGVLSALILWGTSSALSVNELNAQSLASDPYTDYIVHFDKLFQLEKIDKMLEFGISDGTKYFLDRCQEVTSCEILLPGQSEDWVERGRKLLGCYDHWIPIIKHGSDHLKYAEMLSVVHQKDPALYNAAYLLEYKDICNELFKDQAFDVAFVDPRFHVRGDLINELFDRVPIIVAHDTNIAPEIYGWYKINTPVNYEKVVFTEGQGVTFWIRKDKVELLAHLKGKQVAHSKKLRIFFPQMHPTLVQSMALALQRLGHTMVVPGESFDPNAPNHGPKITYGTFLKKNPLESSFVSFFSESPDYCRYFLENVEVIENDEFFNNPPDVLFVNCLEVEKSIFQLSNMLIKTRGVSPKIAHYSGNNDTRYNKKWVKNLIAVDAYTARRFDRKKTNIVFWIPWIDFDRMEFEGVTDSLEINSYIAHYNAAFKKSALVFENIVRKCIVDFPQVIIQSYPKPDGNGHVKHDQVFSLINESCATIHIKQSEGFGYTIVESLAKGRPVFLNRSFSLGSRLMNWCIEGRTAFFFDDYAEFHAKLERYLSDRAFRHQIQCDCAQTIRQLIDNEKQAKVLDHFLQNLM